MTGVLKFPYTEQVKDQNMSAQPCVVTGYEFDPEAAEMHKDWIKEFSSSIKASDGWEPEVNQTKAIVRELTLDFGQGSRVSGNQEGGNGSGGDANGNEHRYVGVMMRGVQSHWKIDSAPVAGMWLAAEATRVNLRNSVPMYSSVKVVQAYQQRTDPGLTFYFDSLDAAYRWLKVDGWPLYQIYAQVRIVAVIKP